MPQPIRPTQTLRQFLDNPTFNKRHLRAYVETLPYVSNPAFLHEEIRIATKEILTIQCHEENGRLSSSDKTRERNITLALTELHRAFARLSLLQPAVSSP